MRPIPLRPVPVHRSLLPMPEICGRLILIFIVICITLYMAGVFGASHIPH